MNYNEFVTSIIEKGIIETLETARSSGKFPEFLDCVCHGTVVTDTWLAPGEELTKEKAIKAFWADSKINFFWGNPKEQ